MTTDPEGTQGVFPTIMTETAATELTQPFWDAAKENRLVCARCTGCGTFRLPPGPFCRVCQQREVEWVELPGTGTVYSFTIVRHPLAKMLQPAVPYAAGIIELDGTQGAGARMIFEHRRLRRRGSQDRRPGRDRLGARQRGDVRPSLPPARGLGAPADDPGNTELRGAQRHEQDLGELR